jgi:hypothetical protein
MLLLLLKIPLLLLRLLLLLDRPLLTQLLQLMPHR